MDPAVAQDIAKNRKVQKLLKFLVEEMDKLNSIDDIELGDPVLVAIEVKARKLAFNKIKEVIKPILEASKIELKFNRQDYIT